MDKRQRQLPLRPLLIQIPDTFPKLPTRNVPILFATFRPASSIRRKACLYELDTLSVAKDAGKESYAKMFPFDLKGAERNNDAGLDLGAIERIEKKK